MALATQCPHCYTSFRVANDQLKLHAGMVRCGACKQTFNGIEHLLAPGEPPRTPPVPEVAQAAATTDDASITQPSASAPSDLEEARVVLDNQQADQHLSSQTPETETTEEATVEVPEEFAAYLSASDADQVNSNTEATSTSSVSNDHSAQTENEPAQASQEEHTSSQQELDDIALFQEKLASFAAMVDSPSAEPSWHDVAEEETTTINEPNNDQLVAEQYSSQLEIIEQERTEPVEDHTAIEDDPTNTKDGNKRGALTASLDFELSDEERSWQESAQLSQLEVETKAAVSAVDEHSYSRHEPTFSDDTILEDDIEQDLHALLTESPTIEAKPDTDIKPVKAPIFTPTPTEPTISTKDPEPEPVHIDDDTPEFMLQAERAKKYSKWQLTGLLVGIILLATLATTQTVYLMRSSIAAHYPSSKPQLQKLCAQLGCEIKLPTQIDQILVEGTELSTLTQDPHILQLSVQLQNKSNMIQAWPMIELILKDSRGKTVLQKVFKPEEYLESKTAVARGFAANSENPVKIHFELTTMKAANYAVEVFYP